MILLQLMSKRHLIMEIHMKGSEFLERQLIKALFKAKIEKALI